MTLRLKDISMANCHLVILKNPYLDEILSGRKTIESRFLKVRRDFFDGVGAGDTLFLKRSSGAVCGRAKVKKVKRFVNLQPEKIRAIKKRYNNLICGDDGYWASKADSRYGVLVWLIDVERIEPINIGKSDWRGWVVLTAKEDFGLM